MVVTGLSDSLMVSETLTLLPSDPDSVETLSAWVMISRSRCLECVSGHSESGIAGRWGARSALLHHIDQG